MRSTTKVVLFARAKVDGKLQQHPVAVFANDKDCKSHAVSLFHAYNSGDPAQIKGTGIAWAVNGDGSIAGDLKFSRNELPYAPLLQDPSVDVFGEGNSAAS